MPEGRPATSVEPLPQVIRQQGAPFPPPDALGRVASDQLVLVEEAARRWGMPVQPGGPGYVLYAGPVADRQVADRAAGHCLPVAALGPDAYALYLGPTEGVVVGGDVRGLQYGLDTLFQLLRNPAPIRQTVVHDWPDLPVRGVFVTCRLGPTDPKVVEDLIRHAARYRLTHLCMEIEKGMRYESHPEVSAPWALGKDAFARFAALAAQHGIEFIPMLPTLTHVGYILQAHPELAEDANLPHPDKYCPSNPATWRLITRIVDEVIELLQPRLFHIGHDEIVSDYELTRRQSIVRCQQCRHLRPADWYAGHVGRMRDFLAGRGVRTMMWADMLLTPCQHLGYGASLGSHYGGPPDDMHQAVDLIPRDVVLCDWHYEVTGHYPSYDYLLDKGFTVLGSPWQFESIFTFVHKVHRKRQELAAGPAQTPAAGPLAATGHGPDRPASVPFAAPFREPAPGVLCTNWCSLDAATAAAVREQIRWAGEFSWTADRAAWLTDPMAHLLQRMESPNPTRDIPPGPFDVEIDLGRLQGGLMWTAGAVAGQDGDGMVLKARRTGFLLLRFTARPDALFADASMAIQGKGAGPCAISASAAAAGAAWPVADGTALDGRVIDLAPWAAGAPAFEVRCDFRNDTDAPAQIIRSIRVRGVVRQRCGS